MTVRRLSNLFSRLEDVPIEVADVRRQIIEWGYHDRIVIRPFNGPVRALRGMYLEYSSQAVYGTESTCAVIRYNGSMSVDWQRLTCVKELIHSMDVPGIRVNSRSKAAELLDKLSLNGAFNEGMGPAAIFEEIATYQAVTILCPNAAIEYFKQHGVSFDEVARRLDVPLPYAGLVMQPDWPGLREKFLEFSE